MLHPLKAYREHLGLTKAQLAARLGVSRSTVVRYETGDRRVGRKLWPRLSALTGIPEAALAGIEQWTPSDEDEAKRASPSTEAAA